MNGMYIKCNIRDCLFLYCQTQSFDDYNTRNPLFPVLFTDLLGFLSIFLIFHILSFISKHIYIDLRHNISIHITHVYSHKRRYCIMASSSKKTSVPEAKEAMNRFKEEVASELGVPLKEGYNGDLTSKQAGSIGGEMVKQMIMKQEQQMK